MLPGALRCIPLVNSYNGLSTVSLAACNCLGAACRRVQAVTASAYCITQRSPATSNPCSTEDRTIRRSSVVQLVQMRALPATSLQVHRLRPRYSAVCSTHVTGTAIQIQTQPAAAAAADPTAVVSQILDLTANTGEHLSTTPLFDCVLSRYQCQAPNAMHRAAYITEQASLAEHAGSQLQLNKALVTTASA